MPKNIRIIDQQSRSIQISWTQPYAGNSPIINYIVQYKEAPGNIEIAKGIRVFFAMNQPIIGIGYICNYVFSTR